MPVLGPDDLIRLAFDDTLDLPPSTLRWRLHTARRDLQRLEDAGQIVREPDGHGGERILEARKPDGG